jgi:hypothetical protein
MSRSLGVLLAIVTGTYFLINWFKQVRNQIFSAVLPELGKNGLKGLICKTLDLDVEIAY